MKILAYRPIFGRPETARNPPTIQRRSTDYQVLAPCNTTRPGHYGILRAMLDRLPPCAPTSDKGVVYVVKRGNAYKIGFSRSDVRRRVSAAGGTLILTIPTGQHPASLERAIHQQFAAKRTEGPGSKQEWFALDAADLEWLRGLVKHVSDHKGWYPTIMGQTTTDCA